VRDCRRQKRKIWQSVLLTYNGQYAGLCVQESATDASESVDLFPPHISDADINRGLRSGKYIQGKFHPSRDNCLEAYVAAYDSEDQVHTHLLLIYEPCFLHFA